MIAALKLAAKWAKMSAIDQLPLCVSDCNPRVKRAKIAGTKFSADLNLTAKIASVALDLREC